jgi:hypothetical protein
VNILLSLDEVLDTRLGTLHCIDRKYPKIMLANNWHDRIGDREILEYCDLSNDEYMEAYGRRGKNVLKHSVITNIVTYIARELAIDITNFPELEEMDSSPGLLLNIYPYNLNKEEKKTFSFLLHRLMPFLGSVDLINVAPKYITPRFIHDKSIYYYFNYDGVKWLNLICDELLEFPLTRLKLYMPALEQINAEPVTQDIAKEAGDVNKFDLIGTVWSMYITIQYLPAEMFSIYKHKRED